MKTVSTEKLKVSAIEMDNIKGDKQLYITIESKIGSRIVIQVGEKNYKMANDLILLQDDNQKTNTMAVNPKAPQKA